MPNRRIGVIILHTYPSVRLYFGRCNKWELNGRKVSPIDNWRTLGPTYIKLDMHDGYDQLTTPIDIEHILSQLSRPQWPYPQTGYVMTRMFILLSLSYHANSHGHDNLYCKQFAHQLNLQINMKTSVTYNPYSLTCMSNFDHNSMRGEYMLIEKRKIHHSDYYSDTLNGRLMLTY